MKAKAARPGQRFIGLFDWEFVTRCDLLPVQYDSIVCAVICQVFFDIEQIFANLSSVAGWR